MHDHYFEIRSLHDSLFKLLCRSVIIILLVTPTKTNLVEIITR